MLTFIEYGSTRCLSNPNPGETVNATHHSELDAFWVEPQTETREPHTFTDWAWLVGIAFFLAGFWATVGLVAAGVV